MGLGIGDWGLGIGDWGLGIGDSTVLLNLNSFRSYAEFSILWVEFSTGKDNIFLPSSNIIKNQKVQTLVIILLYTILYSTISHSFELVLNLVKIIFFF